MCIVVAFVRGVLMKSRGKHAPQSLNLTLKLDVAAFISYLRSNRNEIGVKLTQESLLENILANPAPTIPF